MNDRPMASFSPRLILGLFLAIAGVVLTMRNLGILRIDMDVVFPIGLVAAGLLIAPRLRVWESFGSMFLVGFGTVWLLREFDVIWVSPRKLIPLVLVAIGLNIVFSAVRRSRAAAGATDDSTTFNAWAIFGGVGRKLGTKDFRGGDAGAFCGGWEIDLRHAEMQRDQAEISVFAWWGGGEIYVPAGWDVTVKAVPILGGIEDKTSHPASDPSGAPAKRLIVSGAVVMGGIEISN